MTHSIPTEASQDGSDLDNLVKEIMQVPYSKHKARKLIQAHQDDAIKAAMLRQRAYDQRLIDDAVLAARIDEVERAKDRKQIFDYYEDRIAELQRQKESQS